MSALADRIRDELRANGGWLGFDAFMALALYCPQLGYYCGGGQPFADASHEGGDFVTAPMLGPWLARGIWGWSSPLRDWLCNHDADGRGAASFGIREFGGGRGDLAAGLLRAAAQSAPRASAPPPHVEMMELSADMQSLQREHTAGLGQVAWSQSLAPGFRGLVLANEVLDAMPVRCFEWAGNDDVLEWGVAEDASSASGFVWSARAADAALTQVVLDRRQAAEDRGFAWAPGYRGEHAAWIGPWFAALGRATDAGAVLIMDYGYARHELDHPGRTRGTLCAHYRHRRLDDEESLLADVGRRDLTAHVNFSEVAHAARDAGFNVDGFVTQARFLINGGVLQDAQSIIDETEDAVARVRLLQSLQMVLSESEMGEVFKVMLLTKGLPTFVTHALQATGFRDGDRCEELFI